MDWSDFLTEAFNKPSSRNIRLALSLLFIAIAMMIIMTIFSVAKVLFNPDITLWETHIYTIIFTGLLAPVVALFVLLMFEDLYAKISKENEERKRVEETLRKSEETARQRAEELEKLMDLAPTAIFVSQDPYCRVINGNRAANKFYESREGDNLSAGPASGGEQDNTRRFFRNGRELKPEELPMQEAAIKGVDVVNSELEVLMPSGERMTILGNASPLLDVRGQVRGCIGAFVDITERKQAEEALRESEERFRQLADNSPISMAINDKEDNITYLNKKFIEIFGYTLEDIPHLKYWWPLAYPDPVYREDAIKRWEKGVEDAVRGSKEIEPIDFTVTCKDGSVRYTEISGVPIGDKELVLLQDVTDRKRAVEALRESEEKFRKFFDLPLIGTAITSPEKRFIQVNDKLCEMFGYSREELLKTSWDKITHPEDLAVNFDAFNRLTAGEIETYIFEKRFIHKNGGIVYVILSAACIRREDGTVDYFISTYNDITARKRGEIALQEAKNQAEMYLDLMSHDINNMNQIAIGFLELAQDASTLEDAKELISKPLDSLHSSSKLIENVNKLQKSRLESLKHHAIDLCDVLLKLQKRYSSLPGRDIVIDFVPVPGCFVIANALIEDVFSNLISNSIKHSEPDKPLKIRLGVSIVGEDGTCYYKVTVEDDGPGIPDPMKAKLFMRFQRGTTKTSGKGLGLYLVKTLVDDFNGKVRVEDRIPGDHAKGARFEVLIPALE